MFKKCEHCGSKGWVSTGGWSRVTCSVCKGGGRIEASNPLYRMQKQLNILLSDQAKARSK